MHWGYPFLQAYMRRHFHVRYISPCAPRYRHSNDYPCPLSPQSSRLSSPSYHKGTSRLRAQLSLILPCPQGRRRLVYRRRQEVFYDDARSTPICGAPIFRRGSWLMTTPPAPEYALFMMLIEARAIYRHDHSFAQISATNSKIRRDAIAFLLRIAYECF